MGKYSASSVRLSNGLYWIIENGKPMTALNLSDGTHAYAMPGTGSVRPNTCSSVAEISVKIHELRSPCGTRRCETYRKYISLTLLKGSSLAEPAVRATPPGPPLSNLC